jgi:DNA-binding CsgD family transcriptional regulator
VREDEGQEGAARSGEDGRALLSPRERDVLQLLAEGLDSRAIARTLGVSHATVRTHMRGARMRLRARSRPHAIALALVRGEIAPVRVGEPLQGTAGG